MKTLIVGDIHGCFYELQALLDKAGLDAGDAIISIGDLVDRGPETPQTLAFFRDTANASAIMGNHERKHVRHSRGEVPLSRSQTISRVQFGEEGYRHALNWMAKLPLFIELPEAIIVHGYFEPGVALAEQNSMVLCGTMGGKDILESRYDRPWYELYAGAKPILVGHENYTHSSEPFIHHGLVFGLDTSCVTGRALTGLLLPAFQFVSVPSRGDLWSQVQQAYKTFGPVASPVEWDAESNEVLMGVMEAVESANAVVLAYLRSSVPGYDDLHPSEQAMLYRNQLGDGLLAGLIHRARQGNLDIETARRLIKTPERARELAANLL